MSFKMLLLVRKAALGSINSRRRAVRDFRPSKSQQGKDCACAYQDTRSAWRLISARCVHIKRGGEEELSSWKYHSLQLSYINVILLLSEKTCDVITNTQVHGLILWFLTELNGQISLLTLWWPLINQYHSYSLHILRLHTVQVTPVSRCVCYAVLLLVIQSRLCLLTRGIRYSPVRSKSLILNSQMCSGRKWWL